MKSKKHIFIKFAILIVGFSGSCVIGIQNVKADSTITSDSRITHEIDEFKINTISNPSLDGETLMNNNDNISRGAISKGNEVASYAYKFLGKPYVYGAAGPNAFDCSGLTQYVYNKFGVRLSRTTYTQVNQGIKVDRSNLKAGDLVFFNTDGSLSHVGIYIGDGKFIHAPRTGKPVMINSLTDGYYAKKYATARRMFD